MSHSKAKMHQIRFRWGSAPHPAGGTYSAPPAPWLYLRGPTSRKGGEEGGKGVGKGRERDGKGDGKGRGREGERKGREVKGFAGPVSNCFLRT